MITVTKRRKRYNTDGGFDKPVASNPAARHPVTTRTAQYFDQSEAQPAAVTVAGVWLSGDAGLYEVWADRTTLVAMLSAIDKYDAERAS